MKKQSSFYWLIVIMLLFATALSFMDRQILSISILKIKEDLHITDVQFGFINSGFLISYALMFAFGGIFVDRFGSRRGLGYSVGFWSFATALHAIASRALHFSFFRFLLGVGEGACFPGAVKAVIEWVPKKRQAVANGIAIGGSAFGAMIALPMCALLLQYANWRYIFLGCGIMGIAWFATWMVVTRRKNYDKYARGVAENGKRQFSWRELGIAMKSKESRVFIVMRLLLDPIFYFFMFWIPTYLSDARGMNIDEIGYITWIPFLALGIANIAGGFLSDAVYNNTGNLDLSRKLVMAAGAALTVPVIFVGLYSSTAMVIVAMTMAFAGHGLWMPNYITAIGDTFGKKTTSTIVGLSGSAGAISSLIINPLTGYIAAYSYTPLWVYAGIMYPVAFVIMIVFLPRLGMSRSE